MKDMSTNIEISKSLLDKFESLKNYLSDLGKCAVAFSSGVDSTFLLYAANLALNTRPDDENVIAITAVSNLFPKRESDEATNFCSDYNIKQFKVFPDEMAIEGFCENPANRCYLCKKDLFTQIINKASENGFIHVLEGSNLDDNNDYRPGLKAIEELKVHSPLRSIGFTKSEIRSLLSYFGLKVSSKPSFACLASRIPYGEIITSEKLNMIDKSEQLLLELRFTQFRVRVHEKIARLELLPSEFNLIMKDEIRERVYKQLKDYGFSYIALDLCGYRTGSLNEVLKN